MKIRLMKESDLKEVNKIIKRVFNKPDAHSAKNTIELYFKSKKFGIDLARKYWIGEENKEIIGFIGLEKFPNCCFISWFGVDKKFQNKGVGNKLLDFLINYVKKNKFSLLCVECGSLEMFNKVNKMYEKKGFKEKFRIKDYWSKGDDLILMCKTLI